jgi:carboxyl-terminal processing protease
VTRRRLSLPSVTEVHLVEEASGIGYIHLAFFQSTTPEELDAALSRLAAQGMRALILDLRANPGGYFDAAVQIADRFVREGILVSTRGRTAGASRIYRAEDGNNFDMPLVLLIDGETASAAEILAGAIKDHRRGVLVGQRTFAKGSLQHIYPLTTIAAGIRLTTARTYSPLDLPYNDQGVTPDIVVDRLTDMDAMMSLMRLQQRQFETAVQVARDLLQKE